MKTKEEIDKELKDLQSIVKDIDKDKKIMLEAIALLYEEEDKLNKMLLTEPKNIEEINERNKQLKENEILVNNLKKLIEKKAYKIKAIKEIYQ